MSGDHNMNQTDSGWRKRQIALDKKAENARELGLGYDIHSCSHLCTRPMCVAVREAVQAEREAIYDLVMEAPFKEFDRQEEDFDGEAANAMKAMAFSLTAAIRARGNT
jgi:hypothetical protein